MRSGCLSVFIGIFDIYEKEVSCCGFARNLKKQRNPTMRCKLSERSKVFDADREIEGSDGSQMNFFGVKKHRLSFSPNNSHLFMPSLSNDRSGSNSWSKKIR